MIRYFSQQYSTGRADDKTVSDGTARSLAGRPHGEEDADASGGTTVPSGKKSCPGADPREQVLSL